MENHEPIVSSVAHKLWDTGDAGKKAASTLLSGAHHNLDAVSTSHELYARLTQPGGESLLQQMGGLSHAAEIMCLSTVTQSGLAVLDLCAAVAYRAFVDADGPGSGKEADLDDLKKVEIRDQLPLPIQEWLQQVRSSNNWQLLKDLRDKYTHKIIPRGATVQPQPLRIDSAGSNKELSPTDPPAIRVSTFDFGGGRKIDTTDIGPTVHAYVEEQLGDFVTAIEETFTHPET